ncbi:MAG: Na/Pi cotransporter family protein, partial [Halanaerobiaceae bacterium]
MSLSMLVGLLGGLGLFIYGMKQMSEGLQKTAGKKLKQLLGLLTTNRIAGLLVGTGVTAIIQSSSATTVMVVGFVNAGLMTLKQSVGVIMGANIGTTVTAQLIAFKLSHYSLHAIAIGAGLYIFARRERTKQIGQVILGFGILFLGLSTMKDAMYPLRDSEMFVDAMARFGQSPFLGILLGTGITIMVQSSSASIGILMSLMAVGILDYQAAIPILLGGNIGTTITALLSSIGANKNARRSAFAHTVFNVIGTAVFLGAIYFIPDFTATLERIFTSLSLKMGQEINTSRLLANTHSAFNIINALIWLPFVPFIVSIVNTIIPGEEEKIERGLKYLDERMLETPGMVMTQVKNEVVRMHRIAADMVIDARQAMMNGDLKIAAHIEECEDIINNIEEELVVF